MPTTRRAYFISVGQVNAPITPVCYSCPADKFKRVKVVVNLRGITLTIVVSIHSVLPNNKK